MLGVAARFFLLGSLFRSFFARFPRGHLADLGLLQPDLLHLPAGLGALESLDIDRVGERAPELLGIPPVAFVRTLRALGFAALRAALGAVQPGVHRLQLAPVAVFFRALDAALDGGTPDTAFALDRFHRDGDDG
jgi:hypothetical protein